MMLDRGSRDGARLLGRKTVEYMTCDHLGPITGAGRLSPGSGYGFGLGFALRRETRLASLTGTQGDYTWGGAYGTAFWVDPKELGPLPAETAAFRASCQGPRFVH